MGRPAPGTVHGPPHCVQLSSSLNDITCTQSPLCPPAVTPASSSEPGTAPARGEREARRRRRGRPGSPSIQPRDPERQEQRSGPRPLSFTTPNASQFGVLNPFSYQPRTPQHLDITWKQGGSKMPNSSQPFLVFKGFTFPVKAQAPGVLQMASHHMRLVYPGLGGQAKARNLDKRPPGAVRR